MSAPALLLQEIKARGVVLRVENDELKLRARRAALDGRVLAEVRAAKPALIELLREREAAPDAGANALAKLAREVEAARVGSHVAATARVVSAWCEAEAATEMPLTLRGEFRAPYVREVREFCPARFTTRKRQRLRRGDSLKRAK